MIVYFDTNVFDHIEQRNGVSDWELYVLERAVKDEKISLILSFLNLEETLFLVKTQPKRAKARINLILGLASFRLFIKSQEIVIGDEIRSYALGTPSITPFCDFEPYMELSVRNALDPSMPHDVKELLDEVRFDKEKFKVSLEKCKKELLPHSQKIGVSAYSFGKCWESNSGWLAEDFAESAGVLEECRSRGLEGMLKLKSVRLAIGANLSVMYSHQFEGVNPDMGDSRDILHAVLASSADIFVTHDGNFARALRRIPVDGFHVIDIHSLVTALDRRGDPDWNVLKN